MDSPVEASKNYLFNFDSSANLLCLGKVSLNYHITDYLVELSGYNSSQISEPEIKFIGTPLISSLFSLTHIS
jgi:hypothetical protein